MPLPAVVNANWPLLRILWCPTSNGVYDTNPVYYTDITRRCLKGWAISRGRQYELDTYMAGTFTAVCKNADGALNPLAPSSPLAPYVTPQRRLLVEAQWPPTPNQLTADQSSAGEASGYAPGPVPAVMDTVTETTGATLTLAASAHAFAGAQVYQVAMPAAATTGQSAVTIRHLPVETPGLGLSALYYSWSAYIRCANAGANPSVAARIAWYNAAGTQIATTTGSALALTGSSSAIPVRVAVTARPPAGAAWAYAQAVTAGATPAGTWTLECDGAQFEQGGAPSGWRQPGTWYPQFAGGVERYPQTSDLSGTRVLTPITATDVLALLPQSKLAATFDALVAQPGGVGSVGPSFDYTLGDSSGSTSFSDVSGNRAPAPIVSSKYGAGTVTPGTAITSATPGQVFAAPAGQSVTRFTTTGAVGSLSPAKLSGLSLPPDALGAYGPAATGGWTRMIAFRVITAPTGVSPSLDSTLWQAISTDKNVLVSADIGAAGDLAFSYQDLNHVIDASIIDLGAQSIGDWHLLLVGMNAAGTSITTCIDGAALDTPIPAPAFAVTSQYTRDTVAAAWAPGIGYYGSFAGDLSSLAQWPYLLTGAQMTAIHTAWLNSYTGDGSGVRAGRILDWAGYTGPRALDAGVSTSLGPATDIDGADALSALQQVEDTEGGELFAAKDGSVTLHARSRRLTVPVPTVVFGAHTAAGEIPYESCDLDYDQTLMENDAGITQSDSGQVYYGVNRGSETAVGTRSYAKNNQSTNPVEVQSQASYYVAEFGHAKVRVATMVLHPSALPQTLWPVCLGLELGQCVRVNWRPIGSDVGAVDPITVTGFVEKIDIAGGPGAEAYWTLQISSAPGTGGGPSVTTAKPWNLALLHTTVHTQALAGANTLVIDALPTASFSTLEQNLPNTGPGMQLTIGSGLGTQETRTISSITPTSVGYTTATITFTLPLANTHDPGESVRETLGLASAATWPQLDAYSALDSMQLTY